MASRTNFWSAKPTFQAKNYNFISTTNKHIHNFKYRKSNLTSINK